MSGKHRAINVIDSDDDDYWNDIEDKDHQEFWAAAGELAESASSSPVKEDIYSFPMVPETPTTHRLADNSEANLIVRSGGAPRTKVSEMNTLVSRNEEDPFIAPTRSHSRPRIFAPNQVGGSTSKRAYGGMSPPPSTPISKRSTSKIQPSFNTASTLPKAATTRAVMTDYSKSNQMSRSPRSKVDPMEISDSDDGKLDEVEGREDTFFPSSIPDDTDSLLDETDWDVQNSLIPEVSPEPKVLYIDLYPISDFEDLTPEFTPDPQSLELDLHSADDGGSHCRFGE